MRHEYVYYVPSLDRIVLQEGITKSWADWAVGIYRPAIFMGRL